jgi:hypothetical protein
MRFWFTILLNLFVVVANGDEIKKVSFPLEVKDEVKNFDDSLIKGLEWNRWTSQNFVVCALNDTQAEYLHKHLELVKIWIFTRWGLGDISLSGECRVICVDNPELFKKFFNIDHSYAEVRRDQNGKIKLSVIFLLVDNKPSRTIPIPLTEVCLAEFNQRWNESWSWWAIRGMSELDGSIEQIRDVIVASGKLLQNKQPIFLGKKLFETTQEEYKKMSPQDRNSFDGSATLLCLMLRKEFGQDKFLWIVKKTSNRNDPELVLHNVCGFNGYEDFNATFQRYITDLYKDLLDGKTPVSYLQIKEK